jgi:glutamyl-tRNA synthetase
LKVPLTGQTVINDAIQGTVKVDNEKLDDYILMRSDSTPTYMLSVVVDDIDMGITHIIRGDDHLNNAYRQYHLFDALNATIPTFAHIPLIHGDDGKKLSKRHGAMAVDAYRDELGLLADAVNNYLCRLGWSHGDDELFSMQQAIEWFDLDGCGKSPSRLDFKKLDFVNAHYIKNMDDAVLFDHVKSQFDGISTDALERVKAGLGGVKERATSLFDLYELSQFYITAPTFPLADEKAQKMIKDDSPEILSKVANTLETVDDWTYEVLETPTKQFIEDNAYKFGQVAQPMRAVLSGTTKSPAIFEIMATLGKVESLHRLNS